MKVADLMTADPITVTETVSLRAADEKMRVARFRHLPVVRGARLVGILSHRDLLSASLSRLADHATGTRDAMMEAVDVSQVMNGDVVSVTPESHLEDAVNTMLDRKIDCLPVVSDDGRLVGILTASDFLKLTRSLLEVTRLNGAAE